MLFFIKKIVGSYSNVYKGQEDGTNRPVAIKVMNLNHLKNNQAFDLILSEINLMKEVAKHPNIVQLFDVL